MKPSKLYEALHALIGERVPLHVWGACGVGKAQIVSQVANDCLDVRAGLDPVDLRGPPSNCGRSDGMGAPKFLPTAGKGILFLDALASAPQMTQASLYQPVLDRKLGSGSLWTLAEQWENSSTAISRRFFLRKGHDGNQSIDCWRRGPRCHSPHERIYSECRRSERGAFRRLSCGFKLSTWSPRKVHPGSL